MSGGDSSRAGTLGRSDKPTEAQRAAALAVVMGRYELGLDDADQSRDIVAARQGGVVRSWRFLRALAARLRCRLSDEQRTELDLW